MCLCYVGGPYVHVSPMIKKAVLGFGGLRMKRWASRRQVLALVGRPKVALRQRAHAF